MDGREYTSTFITGRLAEPSAVVVDASDETRHGYSSELATKVHLLYGLGEIHFLDDKPTPLVVEEARECLADHAKIKARFRYAGEVGDQRRRQLGRQITPPDQFDFKRLSAPDITASMSSEDLTAQVEKDRDQLQLELFDYSDRLLSATLLRIHRRALSRDLSDKDAAKEIREAIATERHSLRQIVESRDGIISVERDRPVLGRNRTGPVVAMRVTAERGGTRVPAWLPATTEWEEPLWLLGSSIAELEALIALQEWVIERRLPYLPLAAPLEYEQGKMNPKFRGGLTRADILLCCLLPGRNEIIPVQVKNYVSAKNKREYNPGVVLVGNKELGLESSSPCVIEDGDNRRTGLKFTTRYGNINSRYIAARPAVRGKVPTRADKKAFTEALEPAFAFFDFEITKQMRLYEA